MRNQALVVDKETETLLSVAVLLKAVRDRHRDRRYPTLLGGGYLVTPDGQKIRMILSFFFIFGDNLSRTSDSCPRNTSDLYILHVI